MNEDFIKQAQIDGKDQNDDVRLSLLKKGNNSLLDNFEKVITSLLEFGGKIK